MKTELDTAHQLLAAKLLEAIIEENVAEFIRLFPIWNLCRHAQI